MRAQPHLVDLAGAKLGQRIGRDPDPLRHLELGDRLQQERLQRFRVEPAFLAPDNRSRDFAQPLVNVATIDSDQTPPDSDTQPVAVLAPPLELTPPPTSTLTPQSGTSNPGFALMLILLGVAGLALGIGFITPVPARVRRRERLG